MNEIDPSKFKGDGSAPEVTELESPNIPDYSYAAQGDRVPELGSEKRFNDDLARMYVQPKSYEKQERAAKIADYQANQKNPASGLVKFLLFFVLLAVAAGAASFFIKVPVLDEYGTERSAPLYAWALHMQSRSERVAMLESMEPAYRSYFLTRERVNTIYTAASNHASAGNPVPTINQLVGLGLVAQAQTVDGFGNPIEIFGRDLIKVVAPGRDGVANSFDDVVNENGRLRVPDEMITLEMQIRDSAR
ncbi:MAG: hypothetical protein SF028_03395 [Candidatus Sumerlaeia bacterium]|nr:hypothetical protein [Candidatus Sumerlaeia bacterium]